MRVRAFRWGTVFLQKGFLTIYFNINFRGDQLFMGHLIKGKLTPKLKRIKKKQKVQDLEKKKFQKMFKDLKLSMQHEHELTNLL